MKKLIVLSLLICSISTTVLAQQNRLIGSWQLSKVVDGDEIYENLKAVYIFENNGLLKAARSIESNEFEVGSWEFIKKKRQIKMNSTLDNDFNGMANILNITKTELVYEKDHAILHFHRIDRTEESTDIEKMNVPVSITRLEFTEADFFNENGEYKYYEDEAKLPWQDIDEMLMSLVNVNQLVYNYSTLDQARGVFLEKTLRADVHSSPADQLLSIDYIFSGYDKENLPNDVELPPNSQYTNLLFPEEENTFRVAGTEQITTQAGTFNCTVVEVVGRFESVKKLWMINNKPGIYAKIISDKPGRFGHYSVFELEKISNH